MISDEVLHGRIPRLGTITTGYGTEATSQRGGTYSQPRRAKTMVFHTNDPAVATAVQTRYGGDLSTDSPTWPWDVITDTRDVDCLALPAGFRQHLEAWRTAECVRRCDGVTMSTRDGRPTSDPCACAEEIARGQDRLCDPATVLPVVVDLDVDRFGVWEVRSNAWGSAQNLKGAMTALAMVGATTGAVPAALSMVDRTVRDVRGDVHEVAEFSLAIARSHTALGALAAQPQPLAPLSDPDRSALLGEWEALRARADELGLSDRLRDEWRGAYAYREVENLTVEELRAWTRLAGDVVADVEDAFAQERAESAAERPDPSPPSQPSAGSAAGGRG